jgi:hypothetical protein
MWAIIVLLAFLISPALGGWLSPLQSLGLFRAGIGMVLDRPDVFSGRSIS